MKKVLFIALLLGLAKPNLNAADFNTTQSRQVLVVAGAGGEEEYGELFAEWTETLAKAFEGNASELVHITNGSEETSARKTIETMLKEWAEAEGNEIWIVLVGHGTFDGKEAKFNLVGKDVSDKEFQHWLKPHDGPLVFINTSSCSAPFINALSGPNRVVATATKSGYEQNFCRFGGYMAGALGQAEADLDKDGAVSVLEAFLIASRKVGEYYRENDRLVSENALLDDNGDGRGTPADWFRGVRIEKKAKGNSNADGLLSRLVFPVVPAAEKEIPEPLRKKRAEVEAKIETLRSLKKSLEADVYYRDLEKLFVVVGADGGQCFLPLVVHPVLEIVDTFLLLGRLPNRSFHRRSRRGDETPGLLVRTRRGGRCSPDGRLDQVAGHRAIREQPGAAAMRHQGLERRCPIGHLLGRVLDKVEGPEGMLRLEFGRRIRVLVVGF